MQITKVDLARVELAANCIRRASKFELDGIEEIMALNQGFTWLVELKHRIAEDLQRQELQAKLSAEEITKAALLAQEEAEKASEVPAASKPRSKAAGTKKNTTAKPRKPRKK